MSQTKAQLIAPVGIVTTQGVVVTGVMTATSFDGDVVGSATSIISGSNLNLGIATATASIGFGGDFTGTATGIQTGAAIKVGVFTATSFTGDFTGTATSMMRGTGFEAGTVTSTAANVTYTITVGSKTGGGNAFYIDGVEAPVITLYPGATYTFDQADSTNGDHPLRLATAADAAGSTEYTDGVTVNGTQGTAGAYTRIVVARNAPTPLYYYCTAHSGMGDSINITNQLQGNVTGNVTGSITGLAGSVSSGGNIHIGVMTATSYYGDASNLTGIAATNFNTQTVTADSSETIIDLADGNCITMTQTANTTVGFASTSDAMDVTLIREPGGPYNISYSSGGVVFTGPGGTEDYLSIPDDADFDFATGDFTIEFWMYLSGNSSNNPVIIGADGGWYFQTKTGDTVLSFYTGVTEYTSTSTALSTGGWHHIAISRSGTSLKVFVDGETRISDTDSGNVNLANALNIGRYGAGSLPFTGRLSNLRIVKGTAVYTNNFVPPKAALTNISGTVLLCCQSDSSTTASTVTPGTITANNSPTAAAQTIALSGSSFPSTTITWPSNVKWNGRSAPTLISTASSTGERQQFQFVTGDTGLNWYAWETFKNDPLNLQAWTWGRSNDGQKGQNDTVQRSSPVQVPGNYQYVSYGPGSSTAIKSDGSLWGWGDGAAGILGQNNNISRSSPTQIGTDNNWKSLQWGNACCWGLKNDNTLWAWGSNPDGQFGSGNVTQRSSPIQISGIWSELQDGGTGSMGALKSDGSLWRWGANNNGELGDNSRVYRSSPIQLPGTWNSMSGGNGVMAAVNTDGELWSMGRNFAGVLGQNQSPSNTRYSSPTQIGTGTDWSTVHMVKYFGGALKTDGSLWVWGNNEYGQLGLRTRNTPDENGYSSPTQVPGAWSNLKSYNNGFVASKSDGSLWIWGGAFEGLLGLNQSYPDSSLGQSSPCQIPGTWNLDNTTNAEGGPLVLKEP